MIYTCPNCGDLKDENIIAQCKKCGSNEIEEQGDDFFCPNCDEVLESQINLTCVFCGIETEDIA